MCVKFSKREIRHELRAPVVNSFSMRWVQRAEPAPRSSYRGAGQHHLLRYSL